MRNRNNYISMSVINEDFSPEDIADVLNSYGLSAEPKSEDIIKDTASPQEAILNYLRFLEGVRINLKEIHWNKRYTKTHEISSNMITMLDSVQDSIAEDMQGFYGIRIQIGGLVPIICKIESLADLIDTLRTKTIELKRSILNVDGLDGVVSILDGLVHDINVSGYLESMEF